MHSGHCYFWPTLARFVEKGVTTETQRQENRDLLVVTFGID